jgi:serine/threonine protein kinase
MAPQNQKSPRGDAQSASKLGRFELRRVLGTGAQATVWLAFDPRLEREVAVKIMKGGASSEDAKAANHAWLREARMVSKLTHPHVVPLFEADIENDQAYLVFEYVAGRNLAEMLKARGALPVHEAVELILGVLKALAAAHQAGIVHRDLKPSNILIDGQGKARVMDFGIASRAKDASVQAPTQPPRPVGTPAYMSPEAVRGAPASPQMDVFSAGLVFIETLCGRAVVDEPDGAKAMRRVAQEDLEWPKDCGTAADDELRAIAMRAISRDTSRRFASAQDMHDALLNWVAPVASDAGVCTAPMGTASLSGTLDFLLRRMRHRSDFPAMSEAVFRIQRIANSENESLSSLCTEILKDVALTNKLLRLVNTAYYAGVTGGTVSTVSRAVSLVGFQGIRNMALSLVLLEHMQDKAHAQQLKEEFLRTLLAAAVASEACDEARDKEEAFLGAMFQNLGRLLTDYYFPDEARQVRAAKAASPSPRAEESAAISVLGLGFEDLGLAVAKTWGLPTPLQACIRKPQGEPPRRRVEAGNERMRWLASSGNAVADAVLNSEPGTVTPKIQRIAERYAAAIGLTPPDFMEAVRRARIHLLRMAEAMRLSVPPGSMAYRLLREPTMLRSESEDPVLQPHRLAGDTQPAAPAQAEPAPQSQAVALLAAGIQDVSNALVDGSALSDVLRMVLETLFRALSLRRVIFCLRDAKSDVLSGRYGLGEGVAASVKLFRVPLGDQTDLFSAVCQAQADTLIADTSVTQVSSRLPSWYRSSLLAPSFAVLPLQMKGATFGLIYADVDKPGALKLNANELALIRTLRNQAVLAFKQAL